jgi:predicted transcriptional regulator
MKNLLRFVRARGTATTNEAASHFARHRGPVHIQLAAMEGKGLVRRVERDGALAWELAL